MYSNFLWQIVHYVVVLICNVFISLRFFCTVIFSKEIFKRIFLSLLFGLLSSNSILYVLLKIDTHIFFFLVGKKCTCLFEYVIVYIRPDIVWLDWQNCIIDVQIFLKEFLCSKISNLHLFKKWIWHPLKKLWNLILWWVFV